MTKHEEWTQWLQAEMRTPAVKEMIKSAEAVNRKNILSPCRDYWFSSLQFDDYEKIHTIITADRPYYEEFASDGLAYSSIDDADWAMNKLYAKLYKDLGITYDTYDNNKERWKEQGILLLPIELTTLSGNPSYKMNLWRPFTEKVLNYFLRDSQQRAFLLFDQYSRYYMPNLFRGREDDNHLVIQNDIRYPSFMQGDIFNRVNAFVQEHYNIKIDWS